MVFQLIVCLENAYLMSVETGHNYHGFKIGAVGICQLCFGKIPPQVHVWNPELDKVYRFSQVQQLLAHMEIAQQIIPRCRVGGADQGHIHRHTVVYRVVLQK